MADEMKELLSYRVATFTSNKDCILDAQHAKLEEISCSRYGSHPAIKLRYSCVSSQSIPCQPLLHAHLLARCASGLLPPLSDVFSPFLTQNAMESVKYQHCHTDATLCSPAGSGRGPPVCSH